MPGMLTAWNSTGKRRRNVKIRTFRMLAIRIVKPWSFLLPW
jgi:hypothetical protein